MLPRWFAGARLSIPCLTCLFTPFNRNVHHHRLSDGSRLRRFGAGSDKPAPKGPPSSRIQHRAQKEHVHGATLSRTRFEPAPPSLAPRRDGLAASPARPRLPRTIRLGASRLPWVAAAVVLSFAQVMACDVERFKKFFHGMLREGVYLAPSAFETGFVSAAHAESDIDDTLDKAEKVFKTLCSD